MLAPEQPDRITECECLAEAIELVHSNFAKLGWDRVRADGAITTDRADIEN